MYSLIRTNKIDYLNTIHLYNCIYLWYTAVLLQTREVYYILITHMCVDIKVIICLP